MEIWRADWMDGGLTQLPRVKSKLLTTGVSHKVHPQQSVNWQKVLDLNVLLSCGPHPLPEWHGLLQKSNLLFFFLLIAQMSRGYGGAGPSTCPWSRFSLALSQTCHCCWLSNFSRLRQPVYWKCENTGGHDSVKLKIFNCHKLTV